MELNYTNQVPSQLTLSFPATSIMSGEATPSSPLYPQDRLLFCYKAVLQAIDAFLAGKYSDFDAHTISNCCHGMALYVREIIYSLFELDLQSFQQEGRAKIDALQNGPQPCSWTLPEPLINLTRLYLLSFIKENDPQKGVRTITKKLKLISPIGTQFCEKIVGDLQKHFANLVALRYPQYLSTLNPDILLNKVPLKTWGKYIQPPYFRTDMRGIFYASNLFSMQVTLGYLIQTRAKIAVINDVINPNNETTTRQIHFFQGNGIDQFELIEPSPYHSAEPIVVFGACAYLKDSTPKRLSSRLNPWLNYLTNLILACDVFYPQFPKIADDPTFNNTPIHPQEKELQDIIDQHHRIQGVSSTDPTLFCLSHIYPASLGQILKSDVPLSFIPGNKMISLASVS